MDLDIGSINKIIKKVMNEIGSSREQIVEIIDNIRNDQENLKKELEKIRNDTSRVIEEVDELEIQDKAMRKKLAEVSGHFNIYTECDIKAVYEKAADVRIKFFTKQNEERALKEKRANLEIALKRSMDNIEGAEKVMNQVSIALGYLEGDIVSILEGTDQDPEMFIGIKILEAQENERKRIARDIHDGPAQHIANVVMKTDICKMIIQRNIEEGLRELEDLKESVKVALKEVRDIIYDLRPMSLDDLGLNQTISEMVSKIKQESGLEVELKLKTIKTEIEPIIQVAIYRIIQEVFNNIKKHSKARHAQIKLDFGTKYLVLIISDDGIGFDVEETLSRVKTKGTSYGLIGIYDRVNQLQGDIDIKSSRGKGAVYNLRLPISREVIRDEKSGD